MLDSRRSILLVDDEQSIVQPLDRALRSEGFRTTVAGTCREALALAHESPPDLVLLDVMLPDGSGFEVCRLLRAQSSVPIILLTARGDETDRVVGLEIGADDYVVKPFSAREVVARIRAVLRRVPAVPGDRHEGVLRVGAISLDPSRREVTVDGAPVELSPKEFDLLRLLMANAGTVLTRDQLIAEVWDMNWFGSTKTLDVHVASLRKKLGEDAAAPRHLHTVRRVGFRFSAPDELEP
jgi:DNA-binding response OmpR family regulator